MITRDQYDGLCKQVDEYVAFVMLYGDQKKIPAPASTAGSVVTLVGKMNAMGLKDEEEVLDSVEVFFLAQRNKLEFEADSGSHIHDGLAICRKILILLHDRDQ